MAKRNSKGYSNSQDYFSFLLPFYHYVMYFASLLKVFPYRYKKISGSHINLHSIPLSLSTKVFTYMYIVHYSIAVYKMKTSFDTWSIEVLLINFIMMVGYFGFMIISICGLFMAPDMACLLKSMISHSRKIYQGTLHIFCKLLAALIYYKNFNINCRLTRNKICQQNYHVDFKTLTCRWISISQYFYDSVPASS